MQTRSQRYALIVYRQIEEVPEGDRRKYASVAHKLPVLIRSAGLTQALAFYDARHQNVRLLDHLADALGLGNRRNLLDQSRTAGMAEYMRISREALTALLWYKRFAQAVWNLDAIQEEN